MKSMENNEHKCSVKGCNCLVWAKGLCEMHYYRLRNTGTVEERVLKCVGRQCSVEGCNNEVEAKGLCMKHYRRMLRTGNLEIIKIIKKCNVDKCNNKAVVKGMCKKHYTKYRRLIGKSS